MLATAACATPSSRDVQGSWNVARFEQGFPIEAEQAQVMTMVVAHATVEIANDRVSWRVGNDERMAGTLVPDGAGFAVRSAEGEGLLRDAKITRRPDGRLEVRPRTPEYTLLLDAAGAKRVTCMSADQRALTRRAACEADERRVARD